MERKNLQKKITNVAVITCSNKGRNEGKRQAGNGRLLIISRNKRQKEIGEEVEGYN